MSSASIDTPTIDDLRICERNTEYSQNLFAECIANQSQEQQTVRTFWVKCFFAATSNRKVIKSSATSDTTIPLQSMSLTSTMR